jgi:hypothetical protein
MMLVKQLLASVLPGALIIVTTGCELIAQEVQATAAAGNPTGAGNRETVAATGGAYRVVPGRTRCRDSDSLYLPHPDCRSGPMVATEFQSQGSSIGGRGR